MNFEELIYYNRKLRGLSQREFGKLVACSANDVSKLERGVWTPSSIAIYRRIAKGANLSFTLEIGPKGESCRI